MSKAARVAAQAAKEAQVVNEGQNIRSAIGGTPQAPADAAEALSTSLENARNAARATTRAAYKDVAETPGEFASGAAKGFGQEIRQGLSSGDNPVLVDTITTPKTARALEIIDQNMGATGPHNLAAPAGTPAAAPMAPTSPTLPAWAQGVIDKGGPAADKLKAALAKSGVAHEAASAAPVAAPEVGTGFTFQDVENVRKQLVSLRNDARRAMLSGGSESDFRGMNRTIDQFENGVENMVQSGKFSGDPSVLAKQKAARAAHADYRAKFTKRGPGDDVGAAVEKILGRYTDTKATPDQIVQMAYGSAVSPGGAMPTRIAQRIQTVFGKDSEEWKAYKQGLISHVMGAADLAPEARAARIENFLDGTKGRGLARIAFSPGDRASLASHAASLRGLSTEAPKTQVARVMARISGADGGPPASSGEIVDWLFSRTGAGNKGISVQLASELKSRLSPDGWTAIRQGMWQKLTNAGEGKIQFEAQALSQRLHEFLNESGKTLSQVLYTPAELAQMKTIAGAYKQMIPAKGTTNPSGTAPMLAKIAGRAQHTLLPLLGFSHGGLPGAALGVAVDRGLGAVANARNVKDAAKRFYGVAPKSASPSSILPGILTQGVTPTLLNQSSSR